MYSKLCFRTLFAIFSLILYLAILQSSPTDYSHNIWFFTTYKCIYPEIFIVKSMMFIMTAVIIRIEKILKRFWNSELKSTGEIVPPWTVFICFVVKYKGICEF